MQKRNKNREGSIYLGTDKRWHGDITYSKNGKRHRKQFSSTSKNDVENKMRVFKQALKESEHGSLPNIPNLVIEQDTLSIEMYNWLEKTKKTRFKAC